MTASFGVAEFVILQCVTEVSLMSFLSISVMMAAFSIFMPHVKEEKLT